MNERQALVAELGSPALSAGSCSWVSWRNMRQSDLLSSTTAPLVVARGQVVGVCHAVANEHVFGNVAACSELSKVLIFSSGKCPHC